MKKLKITIGPSNNKDLHSQAWVNCPDHPTPVSNDIFSGHVLIRVRDYQGLPALGQNDIVANDETYFANTTDTFSLQFVGEFNWKGNLDDIVFGNDFDEPIVGSLP